ncbi:hypothetical protein [Nitrococcus mobilis]|uniref:Uncharacterized protein n=1 Tax=Nitrococcus mobilis Nb-231 TaxID=314278 RepID=A4BVK0_9GAMM|nr:hypothetical protein [Nitrococcus mobilis]EAR20265.1 hypothetical protein NB231_12951 [Nitrococcus mobilis Nb-231]
MDELLREALLRFSGQTKQVVFELAQTMRHKPLLIVIAAPNVPLISRQRAIRRSASEVQNSSGDCLMGLPPGTKSAGAEHECNFR